MSERFDIKWAPVACRDMDQILDYIAEHDCVDSALCIYDRIMGEVDKLSFHPTRCRIPPELRAIGISDYRELVINPYSIFFRIVAKTVAIVGVLDRRRDLEEVLLQRVLRPVLRGS